MSTNVQDQGTAPGSLSYEIFPALHAITKYRIRNGFVISLVPLFCALVLLSLILIFSKLNLYYLEGEGVLIDPQVRQAYFDSVILEVAPLAGYFLLLVGLTFAIGFIVVGWSTSPFSLAEANIRSFIDNKDAESKRSNSWLSESVEFDNTMRAFLSWLKTGTKPDKLKQQVKRESVNKSFYLKFLMIFLPLSVLTSMSLAILMKGIYSKIVSLALHLLHSRTIASHYILAQQEVLDDAQNIMLVISLVLYAVIGWYIAKHLSTMDFVLRRAIHEERFPVFLRPRDVYHSLAKAINEARQK